MININQDLVILMNWLGLEIEKFFCYYLLKYQGDDTYFYELEKALMDGPKSLTSLLSDEEFFWFVADRLKDYGIFDGHIVFNHEGWVSYLGSIESRYIPHIDGIVGYGKTEREAFFDSVIKFIKFKKLEAKNVS